MSGYFEGWYLGELEDIRPCDICGQDYPFLVGEDPGTCLACRRLSQACRVLSRKESKNEKSLFARKKIKKG